MKKRLAILAAMVCLGGAVPVYGTSAGTKPMMFKTEIDIPGTPSTHPGAFVKSGTVYMPVWYVMNALGKLGIQSKWDGHNWKLTLPSKFKVDLSNVRKGIGSVNIYLNNTLIQEVNSEVATDPSSGSATSYMPIWYVMNTLSRAQVASKWNGKTWTFTVPKASTGSGTGTTGSGTGTTGSGTGTTGSGTGTTGTPPVVVVPQPPLPANEVAKYDFLSKLLPMLGIAPDPTGESPFDDIGTSDPNWGYVHAAIEHHLIDPETQTHSGSYEALTLSQADTLYWNALGITNPSYQPGGDPFDWGNKILLNPQNETASTDISPTDEQSLLTQIGNLARGYVQSGGNYQVEYSPTDEYTATFAGDVSASTGQSFFSNETDIQQAITQTYQFFNGTSFQINGTDMILSIPSTVNTNWFIYATTTGQIQYSIDGGQTYTSTNAFDTRELAGMTVPSSKIMLKVSTLNGMSLSFNQLLPTFGGTVSLGQVTILDNDGTVSVVRSNLNT